MVITKFKQHEKEKRYMVYFISGFNNDQYVYGFLFKNRK